MKSILLIGLGRFGRHLAQDLHQLGHEVLAIDNREESVNAVLPYVTSAQIGDSTNEAFLASLGVNHFDVCFVAISNDFQSSLETTACLKELGAKLVVARAERDVQAKFLLRNGADEVIYPERQMAKWAALRYSTDHILDFIELDSEHAIFEVSVPQAWMDKSIAALDVRRRFNVNILAIKESGKMNAVLTPDTILGPDSTLLVLCTYKSFQKCFKT